MYTRCTACRTVFHITVADLKAADGRVVCGQCESEFDALETLSDTLPRPQEPPAEPEPDAPDSAEDGAQPSGEENARDEDDFLREIESLIVDEGDDDFPSPDEVFRVEEDGDRPRHPVIIAEGAEGAGTTEERRGDDGETPSAGQDGEPETREPEADSETATAESGGAEAADEHGEQPAGGDDERADEASVAAEAEMPAAEPPAAELPLPTEEEPRARWPRAAGLFLVLLVALGAWAHHERGRLLRHPAGQAVLGPVYSALGIPASPEWSVADLRILRSAAVADADNPSSLRVSAEFRNAAAFPQPYPIMRISLEDRWGQEVSVRDFPPSAYHEGHVSGRPMRPGERVQASVAIPDPEARADGFRVDLCLPGTGDALVCATEAGP